MKITLDWQQYYREFCRLHGGSPVVYRQDPQTGKGGCLLFRDGWTYSRTDPQGPEQGPRDEADQRKKARDYWTIREAVLVQELRDLRERVTELARLQDQRSAPLIAQQLVTIEDDDGRVTRKVQPEELDFNPLLDRLRELTEDVAQCRQQLADLNIEAPLDQRRWTAALVQASVERIANDSE